MTFAEAATIMMSGKSAIIKPLTVTVNGTYTAPAGVAGYSPVYVSVPDRYDEGYQQGYSDGYAAAEKVYEDLKAYLNGDLPPVTDDMGNVIDNAIEIPDDSSLKNYICASDFNVNGASVHVIGRGGDTDFTVSRSESWDSNKNTYIVTFKMTVRNRITGQTADSFGSWGTYADDPSQVKLKIYNVVFGPDMYYWWVNCYYHMTRPDGEIWDGKVVGTASTVGGTSFVGTGTETGWIYS